MLSITEIGYDVSFILYFYIIITGTIIISDGALRIEQKLMPRMIGRRQS
jgi:hypothetical protein